MPAATIPPTLEDLIASCHFDPLRFVTLAYPWGEKGPLEKHKGPDTWQREFLLEWGEEIRRRNFDGHHSVTPIRMTRSSGHGIGKGVMSAFIVDFIMSTRKYCHGTVTANTFPQLQRKTWSTIQRWTKWCITKDWFDMTGDNLWAQGYRESWLTEATSCAEENSESFAGQHAADSTSYYIFDEASNISDKIFEKADGGLTDGEPMIFVFGNPTRSTGKFYRINFGEERHRWLHKAVDSRTCDIPNKKTIDEWKQDWGGEDSDRFRVQVRGLPPAASDVQFISTALVGAAQRREAISLRNDPIICGLDISRGGQDSSVFRFRRGLDARTIPTIKIAGELVRDSTILEAKALDILKNGVLVDDPDAPYLSDFTHDRPKRRIRVDMMFIDGTGVGGPICDHIKALGYKDRVVEVQFGSSAPNTEGYQACANARSWMWEQMRVWLQKGAIDKSTDLEGDLTGPMYGYNSKNELVLESKEAIKKRRGTSEFSGSPDEGDALCFVGDTLIETDRGPVEINLIKVGDVIITPFGNTRVMIIHKSITTSLTTVNFSNGSTLCGKGEHEIYTNRGKCRLDALTLTMEVDTLSSWRLLLWRLVSVLYMQEESTGFKQQACIFSQESRLTRKDYFIEGFSQTISGIYRKVMKYIIKMKIGEITKYLIWNSKKELNMEESTCSTDIKIQSSKMKVLDNLEKIQIKQQNGIDPKRGLSGIENRERKCGKVKYPVTLCVKNVLKYSRHILNLGRNIAHQLVLNPSHSERILQIKEYVMNAGTSLWRIVIGLPVFVPVNVQTVLGSPVEVYNLTLEKHNAYYANEILVFNCLTFFRPVAPLKKGAKHEDEEGEYETNENMGFDGSLVQKFTGWG